MERLRIAILDDYQDLALRLADWSAVEARADLTVFRTAWRDEDDLVDKLAPFHVVVLMRERTALPARVLARLPNLRVVAMTGRRTSTLDLAACKARGILVVCTDSGTTVAPAELAFALILACARSVPQGHANVVAGRWQHALPVGIPLEGKRLGLVGLGKIAVQVATYAKAFGMEVVAWSTNLTDDKAAAHGVVGVDKRALFETSDVVSIHYGLSERSQGIVGAAEIEAMKPGAILVNTARGPLVDEAALIGALQRGRIVAGLDVYDVEPLPPGHPFTTLRNVVLMPHMGYVIEDAMRRFYAQSVENLLAYLDGAPIRVVDV
ncbi:MAG: D-2-hydroxyacid dehydrogenase family protein [Burkholderiales bacterium]